MLRYYNQIVSNGCTYSVDKIIIKGSFRSEVQVLDFWGETKTVPFLYEFQQILYRNEDVCIFQHYDGSGWMQYKDSWKVDFGNGAVAYFAFGLNGYSGADLTRWKVEFNPNKSLPNTVLEQLIYFCSSNSSCPYVSEFDLAVDIPISRENFFLLKDKRKYQLIMNSVEDRTEYLGSRHEMGFCKLYNKQIESKLKEPMTRFEMTVSVDNSDAVVSFSDVLSRVPEIYYFDNYQLTHDELCLSGTDRVLLEYALQNPVVLSMLSRRKADRIKGYLDNHICRLELNQEILLQLYSWVVDLV
nr:unnamed protein product [uncultured bacterium]